MYYTVTEAIDLFKLGERDKEMFLGMLKIRYCDLVYPNPNPELATFGDKVITHELMHEAISML